MNKCKKKTPIDQFMIRRQFFKNKIIARLSHFEGKFCLFASNRRFFDKNPKFAYFNKVLLC